jgi:PAS domain S-box-containing protein
MNPAQFNQPFGRFILWRLPVAYVEANLEGRLTFVNETACHMQGSCAEQLVGRAIWEFLPHDEIARSREEFEQAIGCGEDPPVVRRPIFEQSGHFRNYELHRRLLRDDEGSIVGICMALFDISEAEHAHREAHQAQNWLKCVIQAIPKAILVTDALGFVRYCNPAASELTLRRADQMEGRQVERCLPIVSNYPPTRSALSFRMALHESWSGQVEIVNAAEERLIVELSASPIVDEETGDTSGVVVVFEKGEMPAWQAK